MCRSSAAVGWLCASWVLRTAIPSLFWWTENLFALPVRVLDGVLPLWTSAGLRRLLKFPRQNSPTPKQLTTTRARFIPNSSRNAHNKWEVVRALLLWRSHQSKRRSRPGDQLATDCHLDVVLGSRANRKLPDSLERTCSHLGPEVMTTKRLGTAAASSKKVEFRQD